MFASGWLPLAITSLSIFKTSSGTLSICFKEKPAESLQRVWKTLRMFHCLIHKAPTRHLPIHRQPHNRQTTAGLEALQT
jgi:hypothetical protein